MLELTTIDANNGAVILSQCMPGQGFIVQPKSVSDDPCSDYNLNYICQGKFYYLH
jgi:hypothetical protein